MQYLATLQPMDPTASGGARESWRRTSERVDLVKSLGIENLALGTFHMYPQSWLRGDKLTNWHQTSDDGNAIYHGSTFTAAFRCAWLLDHHRSSATIPAACRLMTATRASQLAERDMAAAEDSCSEAHATSVTQPSRVRRPDPYFRTPCRRMQGRKGQVVTRTQQPGIQGC